MNVYELQPRFTALFQGLDVAFGTGKGEWVKRPPRPEDWLNHLQGNGPGIGIAPLRPDNTVMFAAIDLDEADFEAAREMQQYIPGHSFIERSRSGNAHVWAFFSEPCEAWVAMGILKEATLAAGKKHVEVFPKNHDFAKVRLGNYINLPYHGAERPVFCHLLAPSAGACGTLHPARPGGQSIGPCAGLLTVEQFIDAAEESRNDPNNWRQRARFMLLEPPSERKSNQEFGKQANLHVCAQHIIENAEVNPITEGHRAVVYFNLAKMLTNWEQVDHDEALDIMRDVNSCSPDRISDAELRRILGNAERGQFTSTGCDDPTFAPFASPDCPIANPRRR